MDTSDYTEKDLQRIEDLVKSKNIVIFTCSYYSSVSDLRLKQCLETLNHASYGSNTVATVVVDGSPTEVHEYLKSSSPNTIICKEKGTFGKGKGGALREAAFVASTLPGVIDDTWICWQEAEKSDMMRCWQSEIFEASPKIGNDVDIVCPKREDGNFKESYPIEQYHSESYGNYYMNAVMKNALNVINKKNSQDVAIHCNSIDWHFGPFAYRKKIQDFWLEYKGTSYDAQLIPIVAAVRKGIRVESSLEVTFRLDEKMKEQEEDNVDFIEKRLHQLNDLDPKIKAFWTEPLYL